MSTDLEQMSKEVASMGGKLDDFIKSFNEFKTQYEEDMRGDKEINGKKGIVNEIRQIKKYHTDYPSILYLLKYKTTRTTLTIFGAGLLIYFIGLIIFIQLGPTALVEAFLKLLGIPLL